MNDTYYLNILVIIQFTFTRTCMYLVETLDDQLIASINNIDDKEKLDELIHTNLFFDSSIDPYLVTPNIRITSIVIKI